MIHLVYGGSGSGKSAYAEKIVMEMNTRNKYYMATMKVFGEEGLKKVIRHKKLRAGKGFVTLERETLDAKPAAGDVIEKTGSALLIECISNLVANEMFRGEEIIPPEKVTAKIRRDFDAIKNAAENIVIVSNNVFEDGIDYDETTVKYIKALACTNIFLAGIADRITEVVCGIPVEIK